MCPSDMRDGTLFSHAPYPASCIVYLVSCIPRVRVFRSMRRAFRLVSGTRYRVPAIWHLGPGTRHLSQSDAEGRTLSTEDRVRPPENAHTGSASCILHTPCAGFSKTGARYRVPGIGYRRSGTWDLGPGTGAESTPKAGHRAPRTEPGHRKTRTPGLHPVSCILS